MEKKSLNEFIFDEKEESKNKINKSQNVGRKRSRADSEKMKKFSITPKTCPQTSSGKSSLSSRILQHFYEYFH